MLIHGYKTCLLWRTKHFMHQESNSFIIPAFPSAHALLSMKEKSEWNRKIRNDNSILKAVWDPESCFIHDFISYFFLLHRAPPAFHLAGLNAYWQELKAKWETATIACVDTASQQPGLNLCSLPFLPIHSPCHLAPIPSHTSLCFASGSCHFVSNTVKNFSHLISLSHFLFFCLPP